MMNKKGDIIPGIWSKFFEGTLPLLYVVSVCILIWMGASERSAETTYQATELANSIDVLVSFDGQIKLVSNLIADDFALKFNDDSVEVFINKSGTLASHRTRKVHTPESLVVKKLFQLNGQVLPSDLSQVQMAMTDDVLTIAGSVPSNKNLDRVQVKLGEYDCKSLSAPTTKDGIFISSMAGFSDKVYLDSRISNQKSSADQALVELSFTNRQTSTAPNSILIYSANNEVSSKFACELANAFATGGITGNSATQFNVINVPAEYNPYLHIQEPVVLISTVLQSNSASSELDKYNTIAKKIEEAYLKI